MNEKKYKSVVVIWGVILLTLQALALIDVVGLRPNLYNQLSKLETSFIAVGLLILILAYMLLSLNKKKSGAIIGVLTGLLYMLTFNVANMIAGIFFIAYCAWILFEEICAKMEQLVQEGKMTELESRIIVELSKKVVDKKKEEITEQKSAS